MSNGDWVILGYYFVMKLWRILLPLAVLATMGLGGGLVYLLMR